MENFRKMVLWLMVLMMATFLVECRDCVLHRVGGGRYSWAPNINFTEWSSHEQFYKGDWLYFGFDKHLYNVLEVNKTSYENCIDKNFIENITKGGRDVFNLAEAKPYYFLSGKGYCFKGMKVAVYVRDNIPPLGAPFLVYNAHVAMSGRVCQPSIRNPLGMDSGDLMGERKRVVVVRRCWDL
ncbi:early nodulin-like protein 20 [Alnus glutinosa]|uniref:early nodulin-like protein 20 n=1 Tax=Alnus glutinosa TaxID=3517 RepID=UPI002D782CBA|nr:early nodulin-like protein 20 [Alnus glutinosa]